MALPQPVSNEFFYELQAVVQPQLLGRGAPIVPECSLKEEGEEDSEAAFVNVRCRRLRTLLKHHSRAGAPQVPSALNKVDSEAVPLEKVGGGAPEA